MQNVRRLTVTASVVLASFLLTLPAAVAQTAGEFNRVPEAAPQNWGWLFMAVPIMIVSILFVVVFWMIYGRVMTRLRYPRPRRS